VVVTRPALAPSLVNLRREIDLRWPDRMKTSDGWIGDPAHAQRSSDHNPDARGIVHALDVTARGIAPWPLIVAVTHHPSTFYVIFRGLLISRTHDFKPVAYVGADPHEEHFHVSIKRTLQAERSRRFWIGVAT